MPDRKTPKANPSGMADPMLAFCGLESALADGSAQLHRCQLYRDIQVMLDEPNGRTRFTYANVAEGRLQAMAMFVQAPPIDKTPCFQIGYAVHEALRRRGLGSQTLQHAIEEFVHGMCRTPLKKFYLEAVVSTTNVPSNSIAKRLIAEMPTMTNDDNSGEPILQYLRLVRCAGADE